MNTVVAQVAEVSVEDGRVRVHRITCAVDCGLVINPDGATAQVEGGIMMALGSTLSERMTLKDGQAIAANRTVAIADLLDGEPLTSEGHVEPGDTSKQVRQATYGAYFAEVGVNAVTG